jgi:dihydropteroate synthase
MISWQSAQSTIVDSHDPTPKVMAIVNVTPDSFSDGGRLNSANLAAARAQALVDQGADILDFGGESSRPGSQPVSLDEELRRVIPAIAATARLVSVPISIDTTKAEVARQAIAAGASIINDISALTADPAMLDVAASTGAAVVLMHMRGVPATMQADPTYQDVVAEVHAFLQDRVNFLVTNGIARERIAIDPGIGFGKTFAHNILLLKNINRFMDIGCTVLVGLSRKGFLGEITGRAVPDRDHASAVASLVACLEGARVVRVHDVRSMVDTIKVWQALRGWENQS